MLDFNSKFGRAIKKHLKNQYFVWLTTVDAKGAPQPRPVWFVWDGDSFLIFSQPNAYKVKHVKNNPKVSLHFNTTDNAGEKNVIVFNGQASIDHQALPAHKLPAYMRKYKTGILGLNATPKEFSEEYSAAIRIKPTEVRGWV
jgi:PPOX class probable F420-dependent enzyme